MSGGFDDDEVVFAVLGHGLELERRLGLEPGPVALTSERFVSPCRRRKGCCGCRKVADNVVAAGFGWEQLEVGNR